MKATPIPCDCGGRLLPARLRDFDFSPLAGLPVQIEEIDGLRCDKCGGETLAGATIDALLAQLAREMLQQESRLRPEQAQYLRKRLGLTQAELAKHLGLHRQTVARWETGAERISPQNDMLLRQAALAAMERPPSGAPLAELIARILGAVRMKAPGRQGVIRLAAKVA